MKHLLAANWKMNKTPDEALAFAEKLMPVYKKFRNAEVIVCAPFIDLPVLHNAYPKLKLGAQNVYIRDKGPFTGEVSARMVKPYAHTVILGHSERRTIFGETDELINEKMRACVVNKLNVILCIGETRAEKEEGKSRDVIAEQLRVCMENLHEEDNKFITIAYEPRWAISTTPGGAGAPEDPEEAQVMHKLIKVHLREMIGDDAKKVRVIYGGSVKPANAESILEQPDVDGALVGGASLNFDDFYALMQIAQKVKT